MARSRHVAAHDGFFLGVYGGQVAVVVGLGFGREASAQPMHQPGGVVTRHRDGPIEINRTVNASGNVSVAGHYVSVGAKHAGRRVLLRLEDDLAHVIADGALTRSSPLALTPPSAPGYEEHGQPEHDLNPITVRAASSGGSPPEAIPKSSANACRSGYATPDGSSLSRSARPSYGSATNAATH